MTNDFSRNHVRTNIIPISRATSIEQLTEDNRQAREQWAAAQACIQRREQQDKALAYLASKQMEKDRGFLSRLRRLFREVANG